MNLTPVVCALPPNGPTGWGTASRRVTEELAKIAMAFDVRGTWHVTGDIPAMFSSPVLQAVRGVDMLPMYPHLYSNRRVGYSFAEDNQLLKRYALNGLNHFEKIVCGSKWGRDCMVEACIPADRLSVAIQGVDADVFKPIDGTRKSRTFNIWSTGKFEMRKSQDFVIRAVGILMERHKDVRLKAAWHNPWPQSESTMAQSPLIKWTGSQFDACCQHLDMSRVELIGPEPHGASVEHINRCDVGLFFSRCEAGTNLPLMEAMSCGLPVIATTEHGHADVTRHLSPESIIHSRETPIHRGGIHVANWYEPDLEEAVEALEWFYHDWSSGGVQSDKYGKENRAWMARYTWAGCAQSLLEACTQ